MIRYLAPFIISLLCFTTSISLTGTIHHIREQNTQEMLTKLGDLPTPIIKASVLEFHGLAADMLLLKSFTWVGMKVGSGSNLSKHEWLLLKKILDKITDLDRRFWDPYLFAEMMLTWQGGMIDEANNLLLKASKALPDDYRPLYFLGFNEFYFRRNASKAAPYLRKAATKPGAPDFLKGLAARFSLYGRQTLAGIIFLKNLIRQTSNENTRKYLEKRLKTLEIIYNLENKVHKYKEKYGKLPSDLMSLVKKGLINTIPKDPYGGKFLLLKNGRIYVTSQLIDRKKSAAKVTK